MSFTNPVISGFYPDPSICRVDNDYYLVTSSFEYFPGVPIFHSTDLVNWTQIAHCLTRSEQLPLRHTPASGGIFAPTLRYHDGTFYMVTTNVTGGGHFYVTASDPAGEWSNPVWLPGQGIDPSFLFDDDGKVYFQCTGQDPKTHIRGIYQQEIDLKTGTFLTERQLIWTGTGGQYPEAPHMYKIDGTYYLMIAEGGTSFGHMITLARSDSPWGKFEPCPYNPILSHRSTDHSIQATGHGDIVQAVDGSWWIVFLGIRAIDNNWHHLGRETFLAPVTWTDDGWFTVNGGEQVSMTYTGDNIAEQEREERLQIEDFVLPVLGMQWNFLRNPDPTSWSLTDNEGYLTLYGRDVSLSDIDSPAWIGRRQQHFDCLVHTTLDFSPSAENEEAGLTVYMNHAHHYDIALTNIDGKRSIIVKRCIGTLQAVDVVVPVVESGQIMLGVEANTLEYQFFYQTVGGERHDLTKADARYLSTQVAGGFTGVYLAMYATGNGKTCHTPAIYDQFYYEILETKPLKPLF